MDTDLVRERIRAALKQRKLSMRRASVMSGRSDVWISQFLSGTVHEPGAAGLQNLARVLDVDYDNQQVLSSDQLRLEVDAYARFRIINPLKAVNATGSTSQTESAITDALRPLLGSSIRNAAFSVRPSSFRPAPASA